MIQSDQLPIHINACVVVFRQKKFGTSLRMPWGCHKEHALIVKKTKGLFTLSMKTIIVYII